MKFFELFRRQPNLRTAEVRLVQRMRQRYAQVCIYSGTVLSLFYAAVRQAGVEPSTVGQYLVLAVAFLFALLLKRWGVKHFWIANYLVLVATLAIFPDSYYQWTLTPVGMVWAMILPPLAMVLMGYAMAFFWAAVTALLMALTPWVVDALPWQAQIPFEALDIHNLTELVLSLSCVMFLLWVHGQTLENVLKSVKTRQVRIERMRDELVRAQRYKDRFFASISHELRTPLNAINGISGLLLVDGQRPEQAQMLDSLRTACGQLLFIVNDLLDLSKLQEGKIRFSQVDFDLQKTLRAAWDIVHISAREKKLDYSMQVQGELPKRVQGDPHRLMQIAINLLSNAVKFTDAGFVHFKIQAQTQPDQAIALTLEVHDSGMGIPSQFQSQIFAGFAQAENALTRTGGTGLGLYITRQLVVLQGGTIDFESQENQGSVFKVQVPLQPCAAPSQASSANQEPAHHLDFLRGIKVLLVDDNPLNLMVAKLQLERHIEAVQVHTAADGQLAVNWLQAHEVDVVLMDLQMPNMDGFEATAYLRACPQARLAQLPIIAMTANTLESDRQKSMDVGMNGYITKPFEIEQLCAEVERVLKSLGRLR